jgi:hypothetical protein
MYMKKVFMRIGIHGDNWQKNKNLNPVPLIKSWCIHPTKYNAKTEIIFSRTLNGMQKCALCSVT